MGLSSTRINGPFGSQLLEAVAGWAWRGTGEESPARGYHSSVLLSLEQESWEVVLMTTQRPGPMLAVSPHRGFKSVAQREPGAGGHTGQSGTHE